MDSVPTYQITLQRQGMLLPQDAVAEIIPYEPLQRVEGTPEWYLGLLGWRGIQVPVVSFEMLSIKRASFSLVSVASASLVIVKCIADLEEMPYFATVAQTMPRLVDMTEEVLFPTGDETLDTELARVRFEDDILSIPNLDRIEAVIREVLIEN